MMSNLANLLIYILATFRLTELITVDDGPYDMFSRFRKWTGKNAYKSKHHKTLADVVHCRFCVGVWAAIFLAFMPKQVRLVLAAAGGQALIHYFVDRQK